MGVGVGGKRGRRKGLTPSGAPSASHGRAVSDLVSAACGGSFVLGACAFACRGLVSLRMVKRSEAACGMWREVCDASAAAHLGRRPAREASAQGALRLAVRPAAVARVLRSSRVGTLGRALPRRWVTLVASGDRGEGERGSLDSVASVASRPPRPRS